MEELEGLEFKTHNILLPNGVRTVPERSVTLENSPWFKQIVRHIRIVFGKTTEGIRIVDLGCCEGGYSIELAKLGYDVTGIDIRRRNLKHAEGLKRVFKLRNVHFQMADVNDFAEFGEFDVVLCWGILYHLEDPARLLEKIGENCKKLLLLDTHFAFGENESETHPNPHRLGEICFHKGLQGRWFREYAPNTSDEVKEGAIWSANSNEQSFWLKKEYLIQKIRQVGFDAVSEQFDGFNGSIAEDLMAGNHYYRESRGFFLGIKDLK